MVEEYTPDANLFEEGIPLFIDHDLDIASNGTLQIKSLITAGDLDETIITKPFYEITDYVLDCADSDDISYTDLYSIANEFNYEVKTVNNIQILDNDFPGLKNQRRVVQWLFSKDTNVLDFKRFDIANGGYLIAQVTGIVEKGLASVENSSFKILPEVIKSKKANYIISNNDNSLSIEEISKNNNIEIKKALALNQKNATISEAGFEPLVVGYSFGLDLNSTSDFIIGENGVYKLRVIKKDEINIDDSSVNFSFINSYRNQLINSNRTTVSGNVFQSLKDGAEITDNRSAYY